MNLDAQRQNWKTKTCLQVGPDENAIKMSTKCDIIFENNFDKVYFGGQLLSGQAIVTLAKEKSVRGMSIWKYYKLLGVLRIYEGCRLRKGKKSIRMVCHMLWMK